jgi:hypothetical protein
MIRPAQPLLPGTPSEIEVTATAYEEAAEGDLARALRWALEDLIALEARLVSAERAVSRGYVRAGARRPNADA